MNAFIRFILIALLAGCLGGCRTWLHAPGYSMYDTNYFMEPPQVVWRGADASLVWRYGKMGFAFFPSSSVQDGALVLYLDATTSSGSLSESVGRVKIHGKDKLKALESGGAYWWEPDGRRIRLAIMREKQ